jgi:hypothetical protein
VSKLPEIRKHLKNEFALADLLLGPPPAVGRNFSGADLRRAIVATLGSEIDQLEAELEAERKARKAAQARLEAVRAAIGPVAVHTAPTPLRRTMGECNTTIYLGSAEYEYAHKGTTEELRVAREKLRAVTAEREQAIKESTRLMNQAREARRALCALGVTT